MTASGVGLCIRAICSLSFATLTLQLTASLSLTALAARMVPFYWLAFCSVYFIPLCKCVHGCTFLEASSFPHAPILTLSPPCVPTHTVKSSCTAYGSSSVVGLPLAPHSQVQTQDGRQLSVNVPAGLSAGKTFVMLIPAELCTQ